MHLRWQLELHHEGDPVPAAGVVLGRVGGQLQMIRIDLHSGTAAQAELTDQETFCGHALTVSRLEIFGRDDTLRIDDERARPRHAKKCVVFRYVAVQYAERANHLGVGIREEWIAKPSHPLGEMREDFGRVVANRSDTKTLGFEFIGSIFQLHELGFAIRSPIGRAVKQKDRAVRTFQSIEIPSFAVLIDRTEIRNAGTDLEAGLLVVIIASIGSKTSCARSGAAKIVIKSQPKILHCRITRASIAIVDAERGRQLCSTLQRESSLWCQELEIVSLSLASSKSSC